MPKPHILISGAGIGGLTAALALLRRGFDVDVYEQSAQLGDIGAGVQLAADGTRVLIALGLEAAMEEVVCEAALKEVRLWNTGETWKLFDLGADSRERFGAPYWFVHRGDLHRVLVNAVRALKPDAIHTGRRVRAYRDDGDRVLLDFDSGTAAAGDVLIGADGVHSVLRAQIFGVEQPEFTGIIAWRGLARADRLPADLRRPVGTNWLGPGGHMVTYPVRRGELMNFAGFGERADWALESWSTQGTNAECAADFPGWNAAIQTLIAESDAVFKWGMFIREPLETWTRGRAALLGDSCHATLPFLAHGAIMALEDAFMLARCLDAFDDVVFALKRYEALRVRRCTEIVRGSAAAGRRFHNQRLADPADAVDYVTTEWAPERVKVRYDWLFEYDVTRVPLEGERAAALSH